MERRGRGRFVTAQYFQKGGGHGRGRWAWRWGPEGGAGGEGLWRTGIGR